MSQPAAGPATLPGVKLALEIDDADDTADAEINRVLPAVNEVVRGLPVAVLAGEDEEAWPERVVLGANMLGARLTSRTNTPDGTAQLTAQGPVYIERYDPDIAQMLELGAYRRPAAL